jgi:hypothetical protein
MIFPRFQICSTRVFPITSHFYPINPIIKILKRSTNQTKNIMTCPKNHTHFYHLPLTRINTYHNILTNNLPVISILLYLPITHYIFCVWQTTCNAMFFWSIFWYTQSGNDPQEDFNQIWPQAKYENNFKKISFYNFFGEMIRWIFRWLFRCKFRWLFLNFGWILATENLKKHI